MKVTGLVDRGAYWLIQYDDGGHDDVPKDPNVIDTAAVTADTNGQTELAAKFRMWASNIRAKGVPVIVPSSNTTPLIVLGGIALVGVWWMLKKGMR